MIWDTDEIKEEKIKNIIDSLLRELDNIEKWKYEGGNYKAVCHREYNLHVDIQDINEPYLIRIPRKYRRMVKHKIKMIKRHYDFEKMDFVQDVLDHKYPICKHSAENEHIEWCKENKIKYVLIGSTLHIREGAGAVAFKLQWL